MVFLQKLAKRLAQLKEVGTAGRHVPEGSQDLLPSALPYWFGVAFLALIIVIALVVPDPTQFQYLVFRIVLALAAAGVAAMIPGFLNVSVSNWVRASGAIAVFAIVYFFSPAGLVVGAHLTP